ncbi:MAG: diguanylate cyclase (GGDEF)-like protein/PAS domain S-box-containing protein [Alteromonadaceae bacterium]|jgi:diguanylate cyclase (GGDEF)-like protein/PAS domain S-box-containing protein
MKKIQKSYTYCKKQLSLMFVTVVCLVLFSTTIHAKLDFLRLDRLSPEEGLLEGYVTSLLIDKEGFLWLATQGGLNRYDGYQLTNIKGPGDIFDGKPILYLFQDSTGLMWISDGNSGLYTLDLTTQTYQKRLDENLLGDPSEATRVGHMVEQDNGDIWMTSTQNLRLFHRKTGKIETVFTITGLGKELDSIRHLLLHENHLFIATSFGVFVMDINTRKVKTLAHTPDANVSTHQRNAKELYLHGNEVLVGTVEGLYSIGVEHIQAYIDDTVTLEAPRELIKYRNIWRLLPADNGWFYVATDEGLLHYNHQQAYLETLWEFSDDPRFEITDNNILDVVTDKQNNFWLASRTDGAFYWNIKTSVFESIYRKKFGVNQLSDNLAWSVVQTDDKALWVGTQNGLNKVDLGTGQAVNYLVSEDKKAIETMGSVYQIMKGDDGLLWLSTGDQIEKLVAFDTNTGKKRPLLLANEEASAIMAEPGKGFHLDEQGGMWFATDKHFYRYNTKKGTVDLLTGLDGAVKPSLMTGFIGALPNRPNTMLLSAYGQLWLYDIEKNQARQIYAIPGFTPQDYTAPDSWVIDKHNVLWLTVPGHGLVGLDADTFEVKYNYDQTNKLPNNIVYGAQLDTRGNLWLSSHQGVLRLDVDSQHLEHFTHKDGLATNEFNGGKGVSPHTRLKDGRLAYASMLGVTLFDPTELVLQEESEYEVKVTNLGLLSRDLNLPLRDLSGTDLALKYNDIGLKINFSTMSFANQSKTRYHYELTGQEEIKYPQSSNHSILIPRLQPGDYTFTVLAVEPQTGKKSKAKSINISVSYAWWGSPLAYSIYSVIVLGFIFVWWRKRKTRVLSLLEAHNSLLVSEERLQLALKGSQSGVWDWQAEHNVMFEPRIGELLGHDDLPKIIALIQHVGLIHPNDRADFESAWALFLTRPQNNFECTYRMRNKQGKWFWFHDLGMVAQKDQFGKPSRITGTYTNITETRANEEQARLFGEAFKQTRDWVLILDVYQEPIAANQSFRDTFGIDGQESLTSNVGKIVGIDRNKQAHYAEILNTLDAGGHWQGEEMVLNKEGQAYPVILSINAVPGKVDEVAFFVLVLTDITAQKAAENDLRQLANYDSLTGLPNRALLLDRIKHAIEHARRYKFNMALFFIDLDRFKQVNDSLGHDVGDLLLIDVARRLQKVLREGDTVARLGGDEFVILLESYNVIEDVSHIAQKVIDEIDQPILLRKDSVSVSPSIGIALYPDDAEQHNELLKHADVAMYHAKEAGRNNFQYFTKEMNERVRVKLELENKIKQAYVNDEFVNFYQPIVDATTRRLKGFELLLRWQSPEGLIPSNAFIPVAEDIGLIIKMTQNALKQGLVDLRTWYDMGHQPYLSINLSIKDLEQDSLADDVELLLQASGLPPSLIRFEITESALMIDINKAIETMNRLTELGTILALDDFGTGYSSLKYLKEFPIEIIKIDRSFVKDIGIDTNDEAIIDSIIVMANSLGMYCIAEGVETEEQLAFLVERKCALIQGFLFSKPVPKDEATVLLSKVF